MQAKLLTTLWLFAVFTLALALLLWSHRLSRIQLIKSSVAQQLLPASLRFISGLISGFVWASLIAHLYLSHSFAPALEGQDLSVVGIVDSLPTNIEQGVRFTFQVDQARLGEQVVDIPSRISLGWYASNNQQGDLSTVQPTVYPGERWQLTVRLQRPHGNANPSGFDYEVWLLEQGLRATGQVRTNASADRANRLLDPFVVRPRTVVEYARGFLRERILSALPGKTYAGAMVALVIGDQRAIPQSDWEIFNRTGIGHLVSISGLHITMVAAIFSGLAHFIWRSRLFAKWHLPLRVPAPKVTAVIGAAMALLYVLLAGFGIPAQRTLYMLWVVAAASWCGRVTSVSHVLSLAALAVVALDPWSVLWPGFWLSFFAVGIILYASVGRGRREQRGLQDSLTFESWRQRLMSGLRSASHTQYVVTIGLIPITLLFFGQISLISPIANAIAIPLVTLLITPCALLGSVLPAPLSGFALGFAHTLFEQMALLLTWLSKFSGAVWSAPLPSFGMFCCALIGTILLLAPRGWPMRWLGVIGWLPIVFNSPSSPMLGNMTVTAFDIGQGEAVLIETASHRLLYDTGPLSSPDSDGATRVLLPYFKSRGIKHLDRLVISHRDSDHAGGALSILKTMQVSSVMSSLAADEPIVAQAPNHIRCEAGQKWSWDQINFEMLHPAMLSYDSDKLKPNARSCVLKITQGNHSILLPGDIESRQEQALVENIPEKLNATVVLAPHHGSGTSSTQGFLEAVQPRVAIFQVGYRNHYHHPKPQVFQRYGDLGITRVRTDDSGAISLEFSDRLMMSRYRTAHARYWYEQ